MKNNPTIRIVDIAKLAGVSIGTVDRVIHKRGRVSPENLQKVEDVLKMVNYKPNIMARNLVSKKRYNLVMLIPQFRPEEYWNYVAEGISKSAGEVSNYGFDIETLHFDQYDRSSFEDMADKVCALHPDGVVIANFFEESVIKLSRALDKLFIPYVYIDAHIESQKPLAYFGTNSYDSGVVAAHIMVDHIGKEAGILIVRTQYKDNEISNQVRIRQQGFKEYLTRIGFKGKITEITLKTDDPVHNFEVLDRYYSNELNWSKAAITFNSSCHVIGSYLKVRGIHDIYLVGYDLIEKNRQLLKEGKIKLIIGQRPEQQGYNAVKALSNYLLHDEQINEVNYMPIDLLIKENVDYYRNV